MLRGPFNCAEHLLRTSRETLMKRQAAKTEPKKAKSREGAKARREDAKEDKEIGALGKIVRQSLMSLYAGFDLARLFGSFLSARLFSERPLPPLPVSRERVGVRVFWNRGAHWFSESPSPPPSPGVPGEGVSSPQARALSAPRGVTLRLPPDFVRLRLVAHRSHLPSRLLFAPSRLRVSSILFH